MQENSRRSRPYLKNSLDSSFLFQGFPLSVSATSTKHLTLHPPDAIPKTLFWVPIPSSKNTRRKEGITFVHTRRKLRFVSGLLHAPTSWTKVSMAGFFVKVSQYLLWGAHLTNKASFISARRFRSFPREKVAFLYTQGHNFTG